MTEADGTRGAADAPEHIDVLIGNAARGDVGAFEALYDQLAGAVLGLTARVLRSRELAEEVTQEVWLDVWRTSSRYAPERGSGRAWILTMAHRRAVDRVRQEQSAADREGTYAARTFDRPFDPAGEAADTFVAREQVRRGLAALTDLQRRTICVAYYEGHTYSETAGVLGVPLGTIKTRLRDAMTRMRDVLAEERGGVRSSGMGRTQSCGSWSREPRGSSAGGCAPPSPQRVTTSVR